MSFNLPNLLFSLQMLTCGLDDEQFFRYYAPVHIVVAKFAHAAHVATCKHTYSTRYLALMDIRS